MRSRIAGVGGLPARVCQARNGVVGWYVCRCARHHTRHRTVARAVELAGRSGERGRQPERAAWNVCAENALHFWVVLVRSACSGKRFTFTGDLYK